MQSALRIALVVDPLTLRSRGGDHAPSLARRLIERGHVVRGFGAPPGVIPRSGEGDEGLGLRGFAPDVVVAYDALSPSAFQGARVARALEGALVLVEPGTSPEATPLYERFLQGVGERLWGGYVRGKASRVVALDPVAERIALGEGFEAERITQLPIGLDLAHWRPGNGGRSIQRLGLRGRVLLYAGPLEPSLGLEAMVGAFARSVGQREDWTLALAGNGSSRRSLRTLVARQGISSHVFFLEDPDRETLQGLYSASTAFVAPALDDRPLMRPVLRALACGLPVLAGRVARYEWAVQDGVHGLLVGPSISDWEDALGRFAHAPAARQRWGEAGRAWALEHVAWDRVASAFEDLVLGAYAEAVERRERVRGD